MIDQAPKAQARVGHEIISGVTEVSSDAHTRSIYASPAIFDLSDAKLKQREFWREISIPARPAT
jgi:hypothetical protein